MPADKPWKDAIIEVLLEQDDAMHFTDIANAIIDKKLRATFGATPAATVAATISADLKDGRNTAFVRVGGGRYMLNPGERTARRPASPTAPAALSREPDGIGQRIIQAFGMYWRRDFVDWAAASPRLLGQQYKARGVEAVDFAQQIGIYMLHDGREVVYVGRSTSSIAQRLLQHTRDRLEGRWDRFSWFGLREVADGGDLKKPRWDMSLPDFVGILIMAMEAILIEGLEPRQNMRGGDGWKDIEYLQVKDPNLDA